MGITTKLRTARIVSWVCLLAGLAILGRMIPLGLSGEAGKVKVYYVLFMLAVTTGVVATLKYYYLKSKIQTYDLGKDIEMKTLEKTGQHIKEEETKQKRISE
jgi:uncharacterized membrane protein YedE/YeeE